MDSGYKVEREETLDKFYLSYFVTRLNAYNTLYSSFKFGGRRRSNPRFIYCVSTR